jgi:hypothetical protein
MLFYYAVGLSDHRKVDRRNRKTSGLTPWFQLSSLMVLHKCTVHTKDDARMAKTIFQIVDGSIISRDFLSFDI